MHSVWLCRASLLRRPLDPHHLTCNQAPAATGAFSREKWQKKCEFVGLAKSAIVFSQAPILLITFHCPVGICGLKEPASTLPTGTVAGYLPRAQRRSRLVCQGTSHHHVVYSAANGQRLVIATDSEGLVAHQLRSPVRYRAATTTNCPIQHSGIALPRH